MNDYGVGAGVPFGWFNNSVYPVPHRGFPLFQSQTHFCGKEKEKQGNGRKKGKRERVSSILQLHGSSPGGGTLIKTVTDAGEMRPVAMTMWSVKFPYPFSNGHLSLTLSLLSRFYPHQP